MKKILFYTDTPQVGGAELQMFLLAKFLDKHLFEPILVCSNFSALDKWCENFEHEGIEVLRLQVKHKHDPRHYFQLKKILAEREIDILHLNLWNPGACRYAFSAGNSYKIPIIITEHDPFQLSKLKSLLKKTLLKKVSKIITISDNNGKLMKKLYPEHKNKVSVIHNGIDTVWWQSQLAGYKFEECQRIKEEVFLAKTNTLIITTIAELHERKGVEYLIKAVPEVLKQYPNVKLVIIGKGKERNFLEYLVKDFSIGKNVVFLGRQKEIPRLLKSSDIFVLPSLREGFGLVNCEAMMAELPVIASEVGGIPDIVLDGKTGILVKEKNVEQLTLALKNLIANPVKRKEMGAEGKTRVLEKFDAKKMASQFEKEYQSILT